MRSQEAINLVNLAMTEKYRLWLRLLHRQTDRQTCTHTHACTHKDRMHTHRHTDRQTDTHTHRGNAL